jgi:hypothetical protein
MTQNKHKAWLTAFLVAQGCLLLNILIFVMTPEGTTIGILSWAWLVGTIYSIYLFFVRNKKS